MGKIFWWRHSHSYSHWCFAHYTEMFWSVLLILFCSTSYSCTRDMDPVVSPIKQSNREGTVFYSITLYSILFHSILFYSILFYSSLFYSILFCSIAFCSACSNSSDVPNPSIHRLVNVKVFCYDQHWYGCGTSAPPHWPSLTSTSTSTWSYCFPQGHVVEACTVLIAIKRNSSSRDVFK